MDGLLIDSEILWHKAELEIFPSLGVPLDDGADRGASVRLAAGKSKVIYTRYG